MLLIPFFLILVDTSCIHEFVVFRFFFFQKENIQIIFEVAFLHSFLARDYIKLCYPNETSSFIIFRVMGTENIEVSIALTKFDRKLIRCI